MSETIKRKCFKILQIILLVLGLLLLLAPSLIRYQREANADPAVSRVVFTAVIPDGVTFVKPPLKTGEVDITFRVAREDVTKIQPLVAQRLKRVKVVVE